MNNPVTNPWQAALRAPEQRHLPLDGLGVVHSFERSEGLVQTAFIHRASRELESRT
jgi:hypothetical protein